MDNFTKIETKGLEQYIILKKLYFFSQHATCWENSSKYEHAEYEENTLV